MTDKPAMEIPAAMREMAERNVEQARSAYQQFMDMARQAQDMVTKSSDAVASSAREVQSRALRYAQENMDSSFTFASDLAKARDLKDFLEIQQRYAQKQAMTYTQQAQELGRLMADAAQMAQRKM
ncbi:MAG TPA: phasin family protein [Hyphomicrobiaceae bacterium]|jgi:phasin|nr:phasin family protein [Hyphomicrobiaceae bacterium]